MKTSDLPSDDDTGVYFMRRLFARLRPDLQIVKAHEGREPTPELLGALLRLYEADFRLMTRSARQTANLRQMVEDTRARIQTLQFKENVQRAQRNAERADQIAAERAAYGLTLDLAELHYAEAQDTMNRVRDAIKVSEARIRRVAERLGMDPGLPEWPVGLRGNDGA